MNYYRRYMGDFQRDTGHLSIAEVGAYDRLLDHYYATGAPLPESIDMLCRIARAVAKEERAAVAAVAEQYFPVNGDGRRHNPRADREIGIAQSALEKQRKSGVESASRRWSTDRSTHRSAIQPPASNHQPPDPTTTPQPKAETRSQGSRLPLDWKPSDEQLQFCKATRPELNPVTVAEKFRDHWIAQPGAKGRKSDWAATWRNFVRNEYGRRGTETPDYSQVGA